MNILPLLLSALCLASAFGQQVTCRIMLVDLTMAPGSQADESKQIYECEPHDDLGKVGMFYSLELPTAFVDTHGDALRSGEAVVSISQAQVVEDPPCISYPPSAVISLVPEHDRKHRELHHNSWPIKVEGISKILVVRVHTVDVEPVVSPELIAGRIFGIGDQNPGVNVVSQISNCSFSKLQLVPAQGPGIMNGIGELMLPLNITGGYMSTMENRLTTLTTEKFGAISGNFDHVIYCMPPGSRFSADKEKWIGYAYVKSWQSYFNGDFCASLSGTIHELGHNLNLRHSNEGIVVYGDTTGYMGGASKEVGAPACCFNGNKHWYLGWYKDRAIEIDYFKPWGGYLYSFVDYETVPEGGAVVIRIDSVYLQWNQAKGFNSGTREYRNEVPILYNPAEGAYSVLDNHIGIGYGMRRIVTFPNFEHSGYNLNIEACEIGYGPADYIRLSIHLNIHESTCNKKLFTDAPSELPAAPSVMPSVLASQMPSLVLSTSPTLRPSIQPSSFPTMLPTENPKATSITNAPTSLIPSEVPTTTPDMCEDEIGKFWVDPTTKNELMNCLQLAASSDMVDRVCHREHRAYDLCQDTCKKCLDNCEDLGNTFFTNKHWGRQNCTWLSGKPGFRDFLCRPQYEPYHICGETCNSCAGDSTSMPSSVPSVPPTVPPSGDCHDSDEKVFINRHVGHQRCDWLKEKPAFRSYLCRSQFDAFHKCRETCNSCDFDEMTTEAAVLTESTTCEDSKDKTMIVDEVGGSAHDCRWLANNPEWHETLCQSGHDAWAICPELCGACSDDCEDDSMATFDVGEEGLKDCQWLSVRPEYSEQYCVPSHPANELCGETCDSCSQ